MLQSLFGTKSTFTCYPTRHLKFGYILFLKNLLQTANEMKFNYVQLDQLRKIKRTKKRLKRNIKMLQNKTKKTPYVQAKQKNAKS